jgi:hypothetical protein
MRIVFRYESLSSENCVKEGESSCVSVFLVPPGVWAYLAKCGCVLACSGMINFTFANAITAANCGLTAPQEYLFIYKYEGFRMSQLIRN